MLLPSALPCETSSQTAPLTRLQSALFASPPASPPHVTTQTAIGNLFSTCRSLQALLANPAAAAPPSADQDPTTPPTLSPAQLPSPPLAHAPSPFKLRLRPRKTESTSTAAIGEHGPARMRIAKRTSAVAQQAPRGPNKRRRAADDDTARPGPAGDSDVEREADESAFRPGSAPHTPKRSRIAPEIIPLGLERADYHNLHSSSVSSSSSSSVSSSFSSSFSSFCSDDNDADADADADGYDSRARGHHGTDVVVETDGEAWSTEEDRILVELVLEKLKLTKSDWQDCARSLGKDRGSVGRRWKSLMINGDVGLKRAPLRRPRIHGTWR
ncbi:hypothetical protein VTH06DRAFT_4329 [Thermothelomyces fergusii]